MPGNSKRWSPPNCPICGQQLWDKGKVSYSDSRKIYAKHINDSHLEFERLRRRLNRYIPLAIVIFFGMAGLGAILLRERLAPYIVAEILYYAAPFLAAGIALSVVGLKQKAMRRFRDLWKEQHGASMNP